MQGELPSKDNINNNIIINVEPQRKTLSEFNAVAMDAKFLKAAEFNSDFFVVYPVMKDFVIPGYRAGENKEQKEIKIEDESKAPDASSFFKIGFLSQTEQLACEKPEDSAKHYRRIFREPLENVKELKLKSPCDELNNSIINGTNISNNIHNKNTYRDINTNGKNTNLLKNIRQPFLSYIMTYKFEIYHHVQDNETYQNELELLRNKLKN